MSIFIGGTKGPNSTPKLLRDYARRIGAKYDSRIDSIGRHITRIYFPDKYSKRILYVVKRDVRKNNKRYAEFAVEKPWLIEKAWTATSENDYLDQTTGFGDYATLQQLVKKLNEDINDEYGAWYSVN
jgi:hypothetical protein